MIVNASESLIDKVLRYNTFSMKEELESVKEGKLIVSPETLQTLPY